MANVVLVIHLMLALAIICLVLVQRSEGGGLGIGGGGGGMGSFATARGTADFLTRLTAILAACFMGTSLLLAILAGHSTAPRSIMDVGAPAATTAPLAEDGAEEGAVEDGGEAVPVVAPTTGDADGADEASASDAADEGAVSAPVSGGDEDAATATDEAVGDTSEEPVAPVSE